MMRSRVVLVVAVVSVAVGVFILTRETSKPPESMPQSGDNVSLTEIGTSLTESTNGTGAADTATQEKKGSSREREQDIPRVDDATVLRSVGSMLDRLDDLKNVDSNLSDDDIEDIRGRFLSLGRDVLNIAQSKVTVDPLRQNEENGVSAFRLPRFEEGMELYSAFVSGVESRYGSKILDVLNDRFVNHAAFGQYGKKEVLAQFREDDRGRMNWKVVFLGPTGDVETEYAGEVKKAWMKRTGPLFMYEE